MEYNEQYASRGTGTAALTTGIIGTVGTALGAMAGGSGLLGGLYGNGSDHTINRYELQLTQENAVLKAQNDVDKKIVETFNALNDKIQSFKDEQNGINLMQATYNATNTANIACIQKQIEQLQSMTKLMIPSTNVYTPAG